MQQPQVTITRSAKVALVASFSLCLVEAIWYCYVTLRERGYFRGETRRPSDQISEHSPSPASPLSRDFQPFIVSEVRQETHNVKRIRFALLPEQSLDLPPGRHIQVCVMHNGEKAMKHYTPVTTNKTKGYFELAVKRYEGGRVSTKMHELKPGDSLLIRGPTGRFQYKANEYDSIGMLAGGTGVTPMLQLLKCSAEDPADRTNMHLIFSNSTDKDIFLEDELDKLAQNPRFKVHYACSRPDPSWHKGSAGRVNPEIIKQHLPPPSPRTHILLCGPPEFVRAMWEHLEQLGYTSRTTL